jgi:hypothetical protein
MEVCQAGAVLIVADVDTNSLFYRKADYSKAGVFFRAPIHYSHRDPKEPIYGSDQSRFWQGYRQVLCDPRR